jgi:hypothetical protein
MLNNFDVTSKDTLPDRAQQLHSVSIHLLAASATHGRSDGCSGPRASALSVLASRPISAGASRESRTVKPPTMARQVDALEGRPSRVRAADKTISCGRNPRDCKGRKLPPEGRPRRLATHPLLEARVPERAAWPRP